MPLPLVWFVDGHNARSPLAQLVLLGGGVAKLFLGVVGEVEAGEAPGDDADGEARPGGEIGEGSARGVASVRMRGRGTHLNMAWGEVFLPLLYMVFLSRRRWLFAWDDDESEVKFE